ncbi:MULTISPECIES: sulfur carrier protein ThiS [Spiribacter]|jgi:sulfur carrier protein|uniref:Sulfur carrier protein ThiS n=1 Tax=Spiribacter aquaticus TaxID=1935996 RepID=A0A557RMT6_9GAMM|nr:sulfur carrier protein ThiS [Spiribacter aquaticus]AUB77676.1 thiamine biosynthesis protein ThiS [Spiribacter roseus]KAF0285021.1 thiamine biosynthesis protein ThiS [Spiribacter sp. SSL99]KAF0279531.1 thiamine biosynthesis protein ThiS [Spiribacter roseus]KAF0281785.1 thiamine biosynthesis protein ThiS [Spiribacter roseus]KAF0283790.1 thiamine biosynthesis protein ThiS [Spiribacter roseus]
MNANDPQITLYVNGEARSVPAETTVARLVESLELGQRRIAIELNGEVVPRSEHASRSLNDQDRIEIIRAIGGG